MKITHPSMRRVKSIDEQQTPTKPEVYVVEDATDTEASVTPQSAFVPPIPQEILNTPAVVAPQSDAEPPTIKTRTMLESLLFLGRATKEVEIGEIKFEISTLTQKENAELVKELYNTENGSDLFTIRALTLAYAIRSINGILFEDIPLDDSDEEASFKNSFDKKYAIVENMQKSVTEKIHDAYVDLVDESDNILEGKDDQETGEDLKK